MTDPSIIDHPSALKEPVLPLVPGQIIAGHKLVALIGRGGMAEVWRAVDLHLERHHAIKFLRLSVSKHEHARERFLREARAIARMNHSNIIQVHQVAEESGHVFIIMELVDGESLERILRRRQKLPFPTALSIIRQVAEGLRYAAMKNIVHRDVKPGNILLGADGKVKLVDFGLAKVFEEEQRNSSVGASLGTPFYMSPESVFGKPMDHRSDIYSLGITFYRMLMGELPFVAKRVVDIAAKQVRDPLPEPEELSKFLDGRPLRVIKKMTAKSPDARYDTYDDLAEALAELAQPMPRRVAEVGSSSFSTGLRQVGDAAKATTRAGKQLLVEHRRSPWLWSSVGLVAGFILFGAILPPKFLLARTNEGVQTDTPITQLARLPVLSMNLQPTGTNEPNAGAVRIQTDNGEEVPEDVAVAAGLLSSVSPAGTDIIVDETQPGAVTQEPPDSWKKRQVEGYYRGSALQGDVDGSLKTITYWVDIPEDGEYEVFLYWLPGPAGLHPARSLAIIHTASEPFKGAISQVQEGKLSQAAFNSLGKYYFKAGHRQLLTLSTEGLPGHEKQFICADAVKLVRQNPLKNEETGRKAEPATMPDALGQIPTLPGK